MIIRWSSPYGGLVASSLKGVSAYIVVYIYMYLIYSGMYVVYILYAYDAYVYIYIHDMC